jgi:hypothetical protein
VVHGPVPRPDLGLGRGLDRRLLRAPERNEEQRPVRGRDRYPERMLFRTTGRGLEQRPLPTPRQTQVQGPRRTSLQEPERRPQRALERGPFRGQGLPQPYRRRENEIVDEVRSQKLDARSQRCGRRPKEKGEPDEVKRQRSKCKSQSGGTVGKETTWEPTKDDVRCTKERAMLRLGVVVSLIPLIELDAARPSHRY